MMSQESFDTLQNQFISQYASSRDYLPKGTLSSTKKSIAEASSVAKDLSKHSPTVS